MKAPMGLHETLEVHELLVFKNLCLTKALMISGLVQDEELKEILSDDADSGIDYINQLQELLTIGGKRNE